VTQLSEQPAITMAWNVRTDASHLARSVSSTVDTTQPLASSSDAVRSEFIEPGSLQNSVVPRRPVRTLRLAGAASSCVTFDGTPIRLPSLSG
jgi:hypothetical protein